MPLTIDAPVNLSESLWSLDQVVELLGMNGRSNLQRTIRQLMNNAHPCFRKYEKYEPLTEKQKDVLVYFRYLTCQLGRRGDPLWAAVTAYPESAEETRKRLAAIARKYGVAETETDAFTNDVMEIFR